MVGSAMFRIVSGFLIAGACICAAAAKDVTIGSVSVSLPPPPGFCELDRAQASDARMITFVEGLLSPRGNRLLNISAQCEELKDWRSGKRKFIDNFSQHQAPLADESQEAPADPAESIKMICAATRAQGEKLVADMQSDVNAAVEKVVKNLKFNETRFLGVLAEEPAVCYAALLQKIQTEGNTEKVQVTVFAMLFIRGKMIFYYLFAPYAGADRVAETLTQLKGDVVALKAANKN